MFGCYRGEVILAFSTSEISDPFASFDGKNYTADTGTIQSLSIIIYIRLWHTAAAPLCSFVECDSFPKAFLLAWDSSSVAITLGTCGNYSANFRLKVCNCGLLCLLASKMYWLFWKRLHSTCWKPIYFAEVPSIQGLC